MTARRYIDLSFLLKGSAALVALTALVMLLAGRLSYWQGWVFGGVNTVFLFVVAVLFAGEPDILRERMKRGTGTKRWDRVIMAFFGPMNIAIIVVAALDAGRFHWSETLPIYLYPPAYLLYALLGSLHIWSLKANRFYVSTVRIMPERNHVAVDSGPYRYIRHPGYAGLIVMVHCIALVLGSTRALVFSGVVAGLLIVRTALEDAALRRELPGYAAYARRVRYRLVPGVW